MHQSRASPRRLKDARAVAVAARKTGRLKPGEAMPQPLIVSIPHSLGRKEAVRRIKTGLELAKSRFGKIFVVQEEVWSDDKLQFRVAALGQLAAGTIDVADDSARLEVALPWLLAKVAENLQQAIQRQGTVMLEKK